MMKARCSCEITAGRTLLATAEIEVDMPAIPRVGERIDFVELDDNEVEYVFWMMDEAHVLSVALTLSSLDFSELQAATRRMWMLSKAGWTILGHGDASALEAEDAPKGKDANDGQGSPTL